MQNEEPWTRIACGSHYLTILVSCIRLPAYRAVVDVAFRMSKTLAIRLNGEAKKQKLKQEHLLLVIHVAITEKSYEISLAGG